MAAQVSDGRKISPRVQRLADQTGVALPHELTYKSSVEGACLALGMERFGLKLPGKGRAFRYIFMSQNLLTWAKEDLPKIVLAEPRSDDSLEIQLYSEFFSFENGHVLAYGDDIRRLDPLPNNVWELKTPDLRVLGWFPYKNYFVAHVAMEKEKLQKWDDYKPLIDEVVDYRGKVSAVLPEYVKGGLPDVISNRLRSV